MSEKKAPTLIDVDENTDVRKITPAKFRNVSLILGGRKVPLRYTTQAQIAIEEELDMSAEELTDALRDKKLKTKKLATVIRILGNEGLRLAGIQNNLTDETVIGSFAPGGMTMAGVGALTMVLKGLWMETDHSYEEEQDVVLNEILKKNTD